MAALPEEKDILKPEVRAEEEKIIVETPQEAGVDVEVVDDTPDEDRGREPLPKETVQELEEEDLTKYSKKVQERLKQMKKVWHDERREKERAMREAQEALRFAQHRDAEARELRQRLGNGEKVFVSELSKAAEREIETAKAMLRKAYGEGDADQITLAQEALTDAKIKLKEVQMMRPSVQPEERTVERQQFQVQQPARPAVDPKAEAWRSRNTWFGADEEMTSLALGLHEKLVRNGVDPQSEDYYRQIDDTIKRRFPEYFEDSRSPTATPARKPATVVAPATRSNASPRKVQLSASQVAVAKKLGLSPEAYARELLKLENR